MSDANIVRCYQCGSKRITHVTEKEYNCAQCQRSYPSYAFLADKVEALEADRDRFDKYFNNLDQPDTSDFRPSPIRRQQVAHLFNQSSERVVVTNRCLTCGSKPCACREKPTESPKSVTSEDECKRKCEDGSALGDKCINSWHYKDSLECECCHEMFIWNKSVTAETVCVLEELLDDIGVLFLGRDSSTFGIEQKIVLKFQAAIKKVGEKC